MPPPGETASQCRSGWLLVATLAVLGLVGGCGGLSGTPTPIEPTKPLPPPTEMAATSTTEARPTPTTSRPTPTLAPLSGSGGGRIVFASKRDENYDIYVMNADGSDQRRLTYHLAEDTDPAWSPDGTSIAFTSDRTGRFEIYLMRDDGTNLRQLTRTGGWGPAWSPDGSMIAFTWHDPYSQIYVMSADGSDQRQLTPSSMEVGYRSPKWSPDGTQMVFVVDSTPHLVADPNMVHTIGILEVGEVLQGAGEATYTALAPAADHINDWPAWSPGGTVIVFSARAGAHRDLYLVNVDGSDLRRFTMDDNYDEFAPTWSPDGTRIAFQYSAAGGWDIYTINLDGTGLARLTTDFANDVAPSWVR